jgi:hypothetical protein
MRKRSMRKRSMRKRSMRKRSMRNRKRSVQKRSVQKRSTRKRRQRGGFDADLVANLIAQGNELANRLELQKNFYELTAEEESLKNNIEKEYNSGYDELIKKSKEIDENKETFITNLYETLKNTTYAPIIKLGGILFKINNLVLKVRTLPQKTLPILVNQSYATAIATTKKGDLDF